MRDNSFLAWTSFVFFALSAGISLLIAILSALFTDFIENPGVLILLVGAFSLIAAVTGFLAFKFPQAKAGAIGGLVLLLLVLFITPIGQKTTVLSPQPDAGAQGPAGRTGIPEIDNIIDTVLTGTPQEQLQLLQFSALACTHAEGFGGPPKCPGEKEEGTLVEAFPILGSEGHHMQRSDLSNWQGIRATDVYAVYRVSDRVYSDEYYPAGDYAIVFLLENDYVTADVTNGKIVRLDYGFGDPAQIDLEQVASEIILAPEK